MSPDQYSNIVLKPCPRCGGQAVMKILPSWPHDMLWVECSVCDRAGPTVYFYRGAPTSAQGIERLLLPGLARARREAAACWNQEADVNA